MTGCPIPFPSDVEETVDGGLNNTPVVVRATPDELAFPGDPTLFVDRADERSVTLHLRDTDIGDTLYFRVFRDYPSSGILANVEVPPTGTVERLRDLSLSTWCAGVAADDQAIKTLEVFLTDRAFLDCDITPDECMGQPQFKQLPASAQFSLVYWHISCRPPE